MFRLLFLFVFYVRYASSLPSPRTTGSKEQNCQWMSICVKMASGVLRGCSRYICIYPRRPDVIPERPIDQSRRAYHSLLSWQLDTCPRHQFLPAVLWNVSFHCSEESCNFFLTNFGLNILCNTQSALQASRPFPQDADARNVTKMLCTTPYSACLSVWLSDFYPCFFRQEACSFLSNA